MTPIFYQNDHLGTPQKLTAVNGAVVWSAKYSSFGKVDIDFSSAITNNLRFAGQYFDNETGLHYNYNRYYDPSVGRYLRSDPLGLKGGINLYSYVQDNPIRFVDSLGLCPENKCDKWELYILTVISFGSKGAGMMINAQLDASRECCMDNYANRYTYIGAGIGAGVKLSFSVDSGGKEFNTSCISWEDHEGLGRATATGIGLYWTYGTLYVKTPQAYLNYTGWGKGIDLSGVTTVGAWSLGTDIAGK